MQGRLEDALNFYDRALKFNPASALAYASRGITFFDFGEYENAALDLERAGGLAPELSVRLSESRGYANFYIAKYEKAAEAFSQVMASEPLPPVDIVTMRALSYFYAGELDKAISDATKAIEIAPEDPKLYYNRANFNVSAGNNKDALADYNEAIKLDTGYYEALLNRGKFYFDSGKHFRSLIDFNRAVEIRPLLVQGYVHRGAAYVAAEMYRQAEDDFRVVLEKEPGYVEIVIAMSELRSVRGDYTGACMWLNKAMTRGYGNWQYVWQSPAFSPIRREQCYLDIVPPAPLSIKGSGNEPDTEPASLPENQ